MNFSLFARGMHGHFLLWHIPHISFIQLRSGRKCSLAFFARCSSPLARHTCACVKGGVAMAIFARRRLSKQRNGSSRRAAVVCREMSGVFLLGTVFHLHQSDTQSRKYLWTQLKRKGGDSSLPQNYIQQRGPETFINIFIPV